LCLATRIHDIVPKHQGVRRAKTGVRRFLIAILQSNPYIGRSEKKTGMHKIRKIILRRTFWEKYNDVVFVAGLLLLAAVIQFIDSPFLSQPSLELYRDMLTDLVKEFIAKFI